jgi:heptosyltransferase II
MRLGVFLPNWVGDVVMATPAIRALRKLAGDGELIGVMRPYVAQVLAGSEWFDQRIIYTKKSDKRELQWPAVRAELRAARLDDVVLLTNSLRTGWMAYRSGARRRIGTVGNMRTPLLTTKVRLPRAAAGEAPLSTIDGYLHIAEAAGCAPEDPRLELATTPADEALAEAVWRRLRLPIDGRVAVFNTGGAFGAAKDWPAEHFAKLACRLVDNLGMHVLVNCGPAERGSARAIAAATRDDRVVSLADEPELPIGLTKALIRRAQLLVTTDSGPRFFGVAFGVATVSLFGPTNVELTRTAAAHETRLSLGLDCQPCMARTCPLQHHRCMQELSVDRVYAAVEAALAAPRRAAA